MKTIALILTLGAALAAQAAMEEPQAASPAGYKQGVEAVKKQDYAKGLSLFAAVVAKEPKNAQALTLLAYCQRKLGDLDAAFENYRKALLLEPKNVEAREYLGEAHIQAALKQIEILTGYGESGKEQADELKDALKKAAAKL